MKSKPLVIVLIFAITALIMPLPSGAASAPEQALPALPAETSAVSSSNYEKAIDLKILGLLATKPDEFELDRVPTRTEGLVMLLRLLGKEYPARQGVCRHPFKDVQPWADNYVGYAYQNGIINGKSSDTFGARDPLSANQYAAMVLRSIGYTDGEDFQYGKALDKAAAIGILSYTEANRLKNSPDFLRSDLVAFSYNALTVKPKGSSRTLIEKLVDTDKAVFRPAAELLGLYPSDFERRYGDVLSFLPSRTSYGYVINNADDLIRIITKTLINHTTILELDVSGFGGDIAKEFRPAFDTALKAAEDISGVPYFVKAWEYECNMRSMKLTVTYRESQAKYTSKRAKVKAALDKARLIVAEHISVDMTDFEKEKILHDYIIKNTEYDFENYHQNTLSDEAFEEYGCLVLGYAVCEGYAKAMKLLCDLAGIECITVAGSSVSSGEGHAWNIVKIDGEYFHLDVTNNDSLPDDGIEVPAYSYFNLTDLEMMKFCEWDRSQYPRCVSTRNNYYHRYGLTAEGTASLSRVLAEAIEKRSPVIEIKVLDYSRDSYADLRKLIIESRAIKRYLYTINDELGIIKLLDIKYFDQ